MSTTEPDVPVYNSAEEVPPLEGWLTLSEAAEVLDVYGRMTVHKMIFQLGTLRQVCRVGSNLLVSEEEVRQHAERRRQERQGSARPATDGRIPAFSSIEDVPLLAGWILSTSNEAASLLGMTHKGSVRHLIFRSHRLRHLRRIGTDNVVLVYLPEVQALGKVREQEAKEAAESLARTHAKRAERAFRERVREWLRRTRGVPMSAFTPVPERDVKAYADAHPDDPYLAARPTAQ